MSGFSRAEGRASRERPPPVAFEDLVEALSAPDAYPHAVDDVQIVQTHVAVLFFAADRAYKLKKPVERGSLDYRTLASRRHFCEEELRLNRRLAPRMYRDVVPVARDEDGWISIGGHGSPVDWVVEMVRLPRERMLDALLERGEVDDGALDAIAAVLARFHERAVTGPGVNLHGVSRAVSAAVAANLDQLARASQACGGVLSDDVLRFLRERSAGFVRDERDLFERRVAQWHIRDGHGDLHAGNVCLAGDDVLVYDCVEFDPALRCGDVASDLAFLAMDLDHRGHAEAAMRLVRTYADLTSDDELPRLLPFYAAHRALIRAKVGLVAALDEELGASERAGALREARRYVQLAVGYGLPASLILVHGGGDARAAARSVAGRMRAELLARAEPRAQLASAVERLDADRSAVVAGDFARRDARRLFLEAATRLGVPCVMLAAAKDELEEPEETAAERIVRVSGEDRVDALQRHLIESAT